MRARAWARRGAVGAIAATLVALGAPGSNAAVAFTPGQGLADAQAAAVAFQYGGASLGFSVAKASGEYSDGTATASAAVLESGFLDLVSGLQTCGQHGFPSAILPPTLRASTNSNGNTAPVHGSNPGTAGLGSARVAATPNADGEATFDAAGLSIPGLLTMSGGSVHARATTTPSAQRRTSLAELTEGDVVLLGGAVRLHGLHWKAQVEVTGPDSRSDTRALTPTFDGGTITIAAVTLPLPHDVAGMAGINALIKPLGVQLRLPAMAASGAHVTVGPLTVALGGKTALGLPLHQLAQNLPAVEAALKPGVFDPTGCKELAGLLTKIPQLNSSWNLLATGYPIIAAALIGSVDGGGELDLNLGGVDASIDDTYYPLASIGSPVFTTTNGSVGRQSTSPGLTSTVQLHSPAPVTATPTTELAVSERARCQTTSAVGHPMCWAGHAASGALAVGVLTVGLLAADEAVRRRRLRRRMEVD